MKLLYLYIESFGMLLKDEGFSFSGEYNIEYLKDDKILQINKNKNYLDKFYGNIVSDITAIVGKNGVGKTTLLDLIGRNLQDRLELSNLNKERKVIDKYFLIYHVKENIFYCETVGDIYIQNIEYYKELMNENNTVIHCFYFDNKDCSCRIIKYDNEIRDKIVYINNKYITSTHDLFNIDKYRGKKNLFLPRVTSNNLPLVEWYLFYIDLCKRKIITSNCITILFSKDENIKYEKDFVIQPIGKDCLYKIDDNISYIEENIEDFYSHFMSCLVNYYIISSEKICEETICEEWNKISNEHKKKYTYCISDYKKIFEECKEIIKNNKKFFYEPDINLLIQYIDLISNLFYALYDIKDNIVPGINEFYLKLSGKSQNSKIEKFFNCFMEAKKFIEDSSGKNSEREDWKYIKNDFLYVCQSNNIDLKLPIHVSRINISTGEQNLIELLSKIAYEVKSYSEVQELRLIHQEKTYIILVDEIESGMHLEWSRNLINFITTYIENQILKIDEEEYSYVDLGIRVQLIFTTHSPFLLSDLNKSSIIALEIKNDNTKGKKNICSFAQNIQRVMNNEFFIKECYGKFSQNKIQQIIEKLNCKEKLSNYEKKTIKLTINEIGEPLLKDKLYELYRDKLIENNNISYEEINLIKRLKNIYRDLSDKEIIEKLKILLKDKEY